MIRQIPLEQRYDKLGPRMVTALKKHYFDTYYCMTKNDALLQVLELISQDDIISWGGSETLKEIGVQNIIKEKGYHVIDRDTAKTPEERTQIMRQALLCDTFLMSCISWRKSWTINLFNSLETQYNFILSIYFNFYLKFY